MTKDCYVSDLILLMDFSEQNTIKALTEYWQCTMTKDWLRLRL